MVTSVSTGTVINPTSINAGVTFVLKIYLVNSKIKIKNFDDDFVEVFHNVFYQYTGSGRGN